MQVLDDSGSEVSSEEGSWNASDVESSDAEDFEGVPVVAMAFNISKGIVGEGILSLPAGIAAGTGVVTALVIMTAFYIVMMYSFWSIGRCCHATGSKTHGEVGFAVRGGKTFPLVMEATNLLKTTLTCTAYALVIGKNSADVWRAFGVEGNWFVTPRGSFLTILVVVLLPLCLLRDLSKLAFSSLFGLACETWSHFSHFSEFYNSQEPGTQLSWGDLEGPEIFNVDLSVFVLIGSMSTAFIAHYNAPKFYHQLRVRNSRSFLKATAGGYTIAFGKNCQGNILHNYSPDDTWATVSRIGMFLATICGFPIAFTGLRTATLGLFNCGTRRRIWVPLTMTLLSIIGVLGSTLTDLGVVNSLGGAVFGSLIELIFPGLMIMWTYSASKSKDASCATVQADSDVIELFGPFEGKTVARMLTGAGSVMITCLHPHTLGLFGPVRCLQRSFPQDLAKPCEGLGHQGFLGPVALCELWLPDQCRRSRGADRHMGNDFDIGMAGPEGGHLMDLYSIAWDPHSEAMAASSAVRAVGCCLSSLASMLLLSKETPRRLEIREGCASRLNLVFSFWQLATVSDFKLSYPNLLLWSAKVS
eukprot:s990_g11.t1